MISIKNSDDLFNFSTVTGTPSVVRTKLADMKNKRIVAFAFEQGNEEDAEELVNVFNNIASLVRNVKIRNEQVQNKAFQAVVDALVAPAPLPSFKMTEAKMTANARNAVLGPGQWLNAAQVAEMAGFSKTNPSAQPNKWKQDGAIFAVNQNGIDLFPGYALNPATKYRPYKSLVDVIKVFNNKKDAWGLAYWFASVNSFLGGARPQDLLANDPDKVIAAAKDEVEDLAGVAHG